MQRSPGRKNNQAIKILEAVKQLVWPVIQSYLKDPDYPLPFVIPPKYEPETKVHWTSVRDYPERKGKYLRPTLLLLTAKAMGQDTQKAIQTAAAMQISEDWLLIHDDLEDSSTERRGKPALQHLWGNSLAINAGDTLHAIMWKVLSDNLSILGPQKSYQIQEEFYNVLMRTTLGQSTEIQWAGNHQRHFTDKDWFFIAAGKTSYYTIAAPMRLGAMIAGAGQKELASLAEFGIHLGRCFQLVDDILDVTSDFEGQKKQTGNDIYEGKQTVLLGHLLRSVNQKDRSKLLGILSKSIDQKTPKDVSWVITKMTQYGSIDYARNLAAELKDQAYEIFTKELGFLSKQPARNDLKTLINFVLERDH